ncbi:DExH-box ATP-dependent RNA helicase DExH16, mitochondrial-like isoform X3 [Corylus avellana]|uniref:DExH-box ATP-dependent RNA helicase DExH16, mitochondrial-like isoform X3 n=1 Tax=Corylus avellana TaxID=13451 RepID=UPI00286D53DF|nr:DExH-box ATP-dependent RNA helicase DExH16, mitochondrial-like isoform X3 [Corylus avellana]
MASFLLRRRVSSSMGVSRTLHAGNMDPIWLHLELRIAALVTISRATRKYSSFVGTTKFDFTDLTHPHTWYPNARKKHRKVILHMGPTNSGKKYHALKQLESSSSGIYCGSLRLLAWEVANRLNKAKVPCDLITGQEREEVDGAEHKAVTVEMADVTSNYHCAVIDEIQMLGCRTRGFSFTRALLGISADELHLCGDAAAVPLIQEILKVTGDEIEVKYYERLSPLVPSKVPLGSFSHIQTGDCIVTFSRYEIYRLKKKIENEGKHLCSVVYGSLPPETRTRQETMFNDASSDYDVLVVSDPIGMGLNLNISRIIFSTMKKFDGIETQDLTISEIKQIADGLLNLPVGRVGQYGSKFPVGEVTCIDAEDLPLLHSSLKSPSPTLERAGLFPTFELMLMYSRVHQTNDLHQILEHFLDNAKLSEHYFIADCEGSLLLLLLMNCRSICMISTFSASVDMGDKISSQGLTQFARNYANKGIVRLREIFTPGPLQVPETHAAVKELESIHKVLDLYVWLSFRLEDSFPDRELASSQKAICSLLIEEFLGRLGWVKKKPMARRFQPRRRLSSQFVD